MSKPLRPDVQAFIATLEKAEPAQAVEIAKAEIKRLTASISIASLKVYLSLRRQAVLERFGATHPTYDMLRLTDEQYLDLNATYQASVSQRQAAPVRIQNAIGMIATGASLLASANPLDIVLGLCLVTGRRPVEIAASSATRLDPVEHSTPTGKVRETYAVKFRGQAKTRGAEASMHNKVNTIPVLDRAATVLAAFERLRRLAPEWLDMDEAAYSVLVVTLNRRCKAVFSAYWPTPAAGAWTDSGTRSKLVSVTEPQRVHTTRGKVKTDTHTLSVRDLRAIYAEACSRLFNKTGTSQEQMKPSEYMARILGHRENDLATSQSYGAYVLTDFRDPRETGQALIAAIAQARTAYQNDDTLAKDGDTDQHLEETAPEIPAAPPEPARRRRTAITPKTAQNPPKPPRTPPKPTKTRQTRTQT